MGYAQLLQEHEAAVEKDAESSEGSDFSYSEASENYVAEPEGIDSGATAGTEPLGVGAEAQQAVTDFVGETVSNIPESAWNFAKDIYQVVRHPILTAESATKLAVGVVQKFNPDLGVEDHTAYADAFGKFMSDRYGSLEKIKDTVRTDPAGFASDAAALFSLYGLAVKAPVKVLGDIAVTSGQHAVVNTLKKTGEIATKAGDALEPLTPITASINKALKIGFSNTRLYKMYDNALRTKADVSKADKELMIEFALENGVSPDAQGLDKLQGLIVDVNAKITKHIDEVTASGKTLEVDDLFASFDELLEKADLFEFGKAEPAHRGIIGVYLDTEKTLDRVSGGTGKINPQQAQQIKKNIYKQTASLWGESKAPAMKAAQMAVAHQTMRFLNLAHPEIKGLNVTNKAAITLRTALEKAAHRLDKKSMLNLPSVVSVGASSAVGAAVGSFGGAKSAAIGGGIGTAVGLMDVILKDPRVSSALAIAIREGQNKGVSTSLTIPFTGGKKIKGKQARKVMFQAGRAKEELENVAP